MNLRARFTHADILVHVVDRNAGDRHDRAQNFVGRATKRVCALTIKALAEFFQATTHEDLAATRSVAGVRK